MSSNRLVALETRSLIPMILGYPCGIGLYVGILTILFQIERVARVEPPRWGIASILATVAVTSACGVRIALRGFKSHPRVFAGFAVGLSIGCLSASVALLVVVPLLWLAIGKGGFYID